MSGRAEKDIICVDRAGVERFVAFGSDIPSGWEYVRDSEGSPLAPNQDQPRTIGNVDAAADHAERVQAEATRAARGESTARQRVSGGSGESTWSEKDKVEDLQVEADRRGLEVEGTGADGKVVKDDLVEALKADDASK